jgi:predicted RNA binding protein YcfA (HicA-like mRNA interferase family)
VEGRRLRGIRARQAVRAFGRAGGEAKGGKGGHINIKIPNGQIITLPAHGELKIGLLKAAIRKAGLTEQQFAAALRGE